MAGAVQGRPDELGHPGVDDDLAAATLADVQDAGDEPARARHERATRFDGETSRAPILGQGRQELGQLAREALRSGCRFVGREDREAATDIERVEHLEVPAQQGDHRQTAADGVAPGVHGPQLRTDVEVDATRPDGARGSAREPAGDAGRLGLGHPELRRPGADRQRIDRLGRDVRVEPHEDVERRTAAASEAGPLCHPCDDLRLVTRFERDPRERRSARGRGADGRREVGVGLADALEGDPVVGEARLGGGGPLAARHDVGAEAACCDLGHDRRDIVGLDRILADPRIRECLANARRRLVQRIEVGDVRRRTEASGGLAKRGPDGRLSRG